jgi:chromosome segregation ATPase
LAVRHITEFAIFDPLSYYVPEFGGTTMGEKERPSGANHSEQADRIQDSMPPVSLTREPTRNDERVSMSPHAETEVFVPEQHSSQTQPAALEREVSSVDLGEYRRLRDQVRTLTEKIASLTEERNELREENHELQAENQELREKVERRKEQNKEAAARRREKNRPQYNAYERERRRSKKQ